VSYTCGSKTRSARQTPHLPLTPGIRWREIVQPEPIWGEIRAIPVSERTHRPHESPRAMVGAYRGFTNKPITPNPTVGITQIMAHSPKPMVTPRSCPARAHGSEGLGLDETLTIP
jgi:hypothetical protein